MKSWFLIFSGAVLLFAGTAWSQVGEGRWGDEPIMIAGDEAGTELPVSGREESTNEAASGRWGGFGAPLLHYLWLDVSAFEPMTEDRRIGNFPSQLLLLGGQGGVIYEDFRFGGFGFGNEWETSRHVGGKRRSAEMSLAGGGVFVELNRALNPAMGVTAGTLLGAGSLRLEASGKDLGPDEDWHADQSFFLACPYLGVWAAPLPWLWVELDGGYLFFNLDHSKDRYENDLGVDMLERDVNGGWQLSLKINFGYNPSSYQKATLW